MSTIIAFVQAHGTSGIIEATLPAKTNVKNNKNELSYICIEIEEAFLFFDEDDEPIAIGEDADRIKGLKHGVRIHVSRCRKIAVTVHYLEKTAEHKFAPGARGRKSRPGRWITSS